MWARVWQRAACVAVSLHTQGWLPPGLSIPTALPTPLTRHAGPPTQGPGTHLVAARQRPQQRRAPRNHRSSHARQQNQGGLPSGGAGWQEAVGVGGVTFEGAKPVVGLQHGARLQVGQGRAGRAGRQGRGGGGGEAGGAAGWVWRRKRNWRKGTMWVLQDGTRLTLLLEAPTASLPAQSPLLRTCRRRSLPRKRWL